MTRRKLLTITTAAALVLLLTSCDVARIDWGPASSSYDGETRVRGSGTWVNDSSARAVNEVTVRDTMPDDGNSVYVSTEVRWWKYSSSSGTTGWVSGSSKSTPEMSSSTYHDYEVSWSLDPAGSRARGLPHVCAQMGWPVPDSCADGGVPTFDY